MSEPDVFDRIRASCAAVADAATHVRIVTERIPAFAASLDIDAARATDPGQQRTGDDESTASFVMALDAVNFGSGWFPRLHKRPGHSGYHTVAASLRDLVDLTGPLTAERLRATTVREVAAIFGQEVEGPVAPLMQHFTEAWHQLADFVDQVGDGRFLGVIDAAGGTAARMVELLDSMPYFHDVHSHPAVAEVLLYKRAQITVQDLAVAFDREGPGRFADLDGLTMFPDNLVPHVLRVDGVLEFAPDLVRRIDAVENIPAGSPEEVEIRACGLHAVELLRTELTATGRETNSADLDNVLWSLGAGDRYKAVPRHRSCSVFY